MQKRYICVTGVLGVGKSTLTKLLADRFSMTPLYEEFAGNIFLPRFFDDKKRWAFHSQMYFLIQKLATLQKLQKMKESVIQDTHLYTDLYAYAQTLYRQKHMERAEWHLLLRACKLQEKNIPTPDVIIHLTAPVGVIYERIVKRNRGFEIKNKREEFLEYLRLLDTYNKAWMAEKAKNFRFLKIDTEKIKYMTNKKDREYLFKLVQKYV